MVINPFNNNKVFGSDRIKSEKSLNIKLSLADIQKYIVDNYIEYVRNEDKEAIRKKMEEYIYENIDGVDEYEVKQIIDNVIYKMFGYHILQKYIDSQDVSDIRVVKFDQIYIKQRGVWKKTSDSFENEMEFYEYVRFCVLKNSGNINFDTPIIIVSDKKYNLRIEAGILPVNAISPSLVIRIHRYNTKIDLETLYLKEDMFDSKIYKFLNNCIASNSKNIVISGKGGSGKTTLLRGIINKIPNEIPITTNEETIELYFEGKNIIQREVLQNREETKNISLQRLMRHSLVMSNDVIVIGELKGEEASIFFDAISTGHVGLSTVHSDSAYNTINRLVTLVKRDIRSERYKEEFIEQLLASSIDYIIHMKDYKINQVIKVNYDNIKKKIIYTELYNYKLYNKNNLNFGIYKANNEAKEYI